MGFDDRSYADTESVVRSALGQLQSGQIRLTCNGCRLPLSPLLTASGRSSYRSPCGCRMSPIDAATVARSFAEALDHERDVSPFTAEQVTASARSQVSELRVGALPTDLTVVWHT